MVPEWITRDLPTINAYLKEFPNNLKRRGWIFLGITAYYAMCFALGNEFLFYFIFLMGFAFGTFCATSLSRQNTEKRELLRRVELYLVLSLPAYFIILWALLEAPIKFNSFYAVIGGLLITASIYFGTITYLNRQLLFRVRLLVFFGPVISGGLAGLAGISLPAIYVGLIPASLSWISLMFIVPTFVTYPIALILAVLTSMESGATPDGGPRAAA